ncbi:flagellar export chaperone FliS [Desulfovibrio sp. TomC]|uniref:flagellar export chaperone FliS n=1 Tax=Desulfovibrio sp. TomC TaxID=1562888 RepID=UPI000574720A|nr:flagellar export chaperone FliS [Desulfovibrio sp. TomC]KHK02051.1 Flagellar biosynthesis protein FliS [Desulfovibrio sp. TomC]
MQSAVKNYIQTQVSTTTQGDLVIMLFDAALKFLHRAKEKIAEKNYAQKGILISKALDILSELQGSLNVNKGGELAERLQKLYFFCSARLLMANLKMDVAKIDEVVGILNGLREAFSEANAMVTTKAVPSSATQAARTGGSAAATIGNVYIGGSTSVAPMVSLAPQAAAGRYASAPSATRPAASSAPRPTLVTPAMAAAASTTVAGSAPAVPPVAAPVAAQVDVAATTARPDVAVPSGLPPSAAALDGDVDAGAQAEALQPTEDAPHPTVSPVRRVMAAYSQGRASR